MKESRFEKTEKGKVGTKGGTAPWKRRPRPNLSRNVHEWCREGYSVKLREACECGHRFLLPRDPLDGNYAGLGFTQADSGQRLGGRHMIPDQTDSPKSGKDRNGDPSYNRHRP